MAMMMDQYCPEDRRVSSVGGARSRSTHADDSYEGSFFEGVPEPDDELVGHDTP